MSLIESLNAVTFVTHDMARAVRFYRSLGFEPRYGGESADFTSFRVGAGHLNLDREQGTSRFEGWGRAIFYVKDVDAMYARALDAGLTPEFAPRDAAWGERYFHLRDPDGHELSFARPLSEVEQSEAEQSEVEQSGVDPLDVDEAAPRGLS